MEAASCPARKYDAGKAGCLRLVRASGGGYVLVDQAAQDGFSADPLDAGIRHDGQGSVGSGIRDALGDALVWPAGVVVNLVFGQYGAQMLLAKDQHAVQALAAQGPDEAFASRVHARSLDGCAQYPGAVCLEDGVEGLGEVRSAVADHELDVLEPFPEAEGEVAGLLHGPLAGGMCGDACTASKPFAR